MFHFVTAFASAPPAIPPCEVCRGYANGVPDPQVEDYIVYTRAMSTPRSRGLETFDCDEANRDDGTLTVLEHANVAYRIDSCGRYAIQRMDRLRTAFSGSKGAEFFSRFADRFGGVGVVSCRMIADASAPDATMDYSIRASGEFVVAVRFVAEFGQDWAERLDIRLRGET